MTLPPNQSDVLAILREDARRVEAFLQAFLRRSTAPKRLIEAIEYSLMAGGKRLRPTLVQETWRACSAQNEPNSTALAAAGAMELIHTFSLVHDDLPAMDNDDLRRGRPTNHKVFGEAMAILAGDGMMTLAFEILATQADPAVAPKLIAELAHASGPEGMIGGQVLDMEGEKRSLPLAELQRLHRMKTGALLTASCRLGAIAAGASNAQIEAITAYGQHLGLAFQIVDDLLDVTASPEELGKATGKDAGKGKNTYPVLLGIDASRKQAEDELESALTSVSIFGDKAEGLRALARFVVQRKS